MNSFASSLLLAIVFSLADDIVQCHQYPIVGVVAQEQTDGVVRSLYPETTTYIYATYIKAIESSGGRVVPIFPGKTESYYRDLMFSINGVVLPGGNATLAPGHPYYDTATIIYEISLEINKQGRYFPLFGVCLGFEFLLLRASGDQNLLRECSVKHEMLPLRFTVPPKESILFSQLHLHQLYTLQYANSTANMHSWCVVAHDFHNNTRLENDWKITSVSDSYEHDVEFIASVEHRQFPIFAVQFHPEVIPFEWSSTTLYPREEEIISANLYFYNNVLHHARRNNHTFASKEGKNDNELLIYNYPATYTQYCTGNKRQIYLF